MATPDDITLTITSLGASDATLTVPRDAPTSAIRALVSSTLRFHPSRLTLILQRSGEPLADDGKPAGVVDGDTLLAVEAPRPPPARVRATTTASTSGPAPDGGGGGGADDDDEDAHLFRVRLDPAARPVAAALARALSAGGVPEGVTAVLTHPRVLRALAWTLAWAVCAKAASRAGVGPVFVCASLVAAIYANLGRRRPGEASAYSVFNEGCRELLGTYNAGAVDRGLRRGNL